MSNDGKAQHISKCLQLAILLEVSSEKPGNVNLTSSFERTTCQHFLASAVAAGPAFQEAAYRGAQVMEGKVCIDKVGLGQLIKICACDVNAWQSGGNTILGTIMLFVPMAAAAGMTLEKKNLCLDLVKMRKNIDKLTSASTALDSVHLYEAIAIANPSGLNKSADLHETHEGRQGNRFDRPSGRCVALAHGHLYLRWRLFITRAGKLTCYCLAFVFYDTVILC